MAHPAYNGRWPTLRLRILERDQYQCQLRLPGCTHTATQVDHIVGIAQGGQPWNPTNLRAACKPCNVAKGNKDNPRGAPWKQKRQPSRNW